MQTSREALLRRFVDGQYERSEDLRAELSAFAANIIEIYPPYQDEGYRFEMWGDQIDTIRQIDPLTGEVRTGQENLARVSIYPKTHYVMPQETTRTRNRHDSGRIVLVEKGTREAGKICRVAARRAAHHVRH